MDATTHGGVNASSVVFLRAENLASGKIFNFATVFQTDDESKHSLIWGFVIDEGLVYVHYLTHYFKTKYKKEFCMPMDELLGHSMQDEYPMYNITDPRMAHFVDEKVDARFKAYKYPRAKLLRSKQSKSESKKNINGDCPVVVDIAAAEEAEEVKHRAGSKRNKSTGLKESESESALLKKMKVLRDSKLDLESELTKAKKKVRCFISSLAVTAYLLPS
jgi:hypothetical protein